MSKKLALSKKLILKEFLPYKISYLAGIIGKEINHLFIKRYDLSSAEWKVIALLYEQPKICASEITCYIALDKVAVSRAVKNLIVKNYVFKKAASIDKRRSLLTLTDNGQKVFKTIEPLVLKYEEKITRSLSKSEEKIFNELLGKMTRYVEKT